MAATSNLELALKIKAIVEGASSIEQLKASLGGLVAEELKAATAALEAAAAERAQAGAAQAGAAADVQAAGAKAEHASATNLLGNALKSLGLAYGAAKILETAEQYEQLRAKVEATTSGIGDANRAMEAINKIALESRSTIGDIGGLYTKLTSATRDLGYSQQEVIDLTKAVGLSLRLSGTNASEASGALTRLMEVFQTGNVEVRTFHTLFSETPALLRALAAGLGVSTDELRNMMQQGNLTVDMIKNGLNAQIPALEGKLAKLPMTTGQAFTQLKNGVEEYIGTQTRAIGITSVLSNTLQFLTSNLGSLDSVLLGVAAGGMVKWGASMLASLQNARALAAGTGALNVAMASLGGPAGVIGLAVAGLGLLYAANKKTETSTEDLTKKVEEQRAKYTELTRAQREALVVDEEKLVAQHKAEQARIQETITGLQNQITEIENLSTNYDAMGEAQATLADKEARLKELRDQLKTASGQLDTQTQKLAKSQADLTGTLTDNTEAARKAADKSRQLSAAYEALHVTGAKALQDLADKAEKSFKIIEAAGEPIGAQRQAFLVYAKAALEAAQATGANVDPALKAKAAVLGLGKEFADLQDKYTQTTVKIDRIIESFKNQSSAAGNAAERLDLVQKAASAIDTQAGLDRLTAQIRETGKTSGASAQEITLQLNVVKNRSVEVWSEVANQTLNAAAKQGDYAVAAEISSLRAQVAGTADVEQKKALGIALDALVAKYAQVGQAQKEAAQAAQQQADQQQNLLSLNLQQATALRDELGNRTDLSQVEKEQYKNLRDVTDQKEKEFQAHQSFTALTPLVREEYRGLSEAAAKYFDQMMKGVFTVQTWWDVLSDNRFAKVKGDFNALAGEAAKMTATLQSGTATMADMQAAASMLENEAYKAGTAMLGLGEQQLEPLRKALADVRQQTQDATQAAAELVAELTKAKLEREGNKAALEDIAYQEEKAKILELEKKNADQRVIENARSLAEQEHQAKLRQIAEEEKAAREAAQRNAQQGNAPAPSTGSSTGGSTAGGGISTGTGATTTIKFQSPAGKVIQGQFGQGDAAAMLKLLQESGAVAS